MSYEGTVIKASSAGYLVGLRHTNAHSAAVLGPSAHRSQDRVQNWHVAYSRARNQGEPTLGQNIKVCTEPGLLPSQLLGQWLSFGLRVPQPRVTNIYYEGNISQHKKDGYRATPL
jgi:hypothetical protein